jgi:hypothetical protein
MKIAIFQGIEWAHYEMIGYAIDYCLTKNYEFEVFIHENILVIDVDNYITTGEEWKNVYNTAFKKPIIWKSISEYNPNNFTHTILLTSQDRWFNGSGNNKLIAVRHRWADLLPNAQNLDTRYLDDSVPWAIPVFPGVSRFEKAYFLKNRKISVILLGQQHSRTPQSLLKKIFVNFDEIEFNFIDRKEFEDAQISNTKYHVNINTEHMIDLIKKSHYIFCINNELYDKTVMSCSVFMAFSYGCRLIIPNTLTHFNFTSPLYYDENSRITLDVPNLDPIFIEMHKIITRRNNVFNSIISPWFSTICERINRFPPSTFVETGTYHGDGIQNVMDCFNTIHSIDLDGGFVEKARIRFRNKNHVYIHHGDGAEVLEKLSNELIGPVFFYLDAHYSGGGAAFGKEEANGCPVLRELSVLGKRNENDIIVIDDMRLMGKTSWGGAENDAVYPLTLYNFEHVNMDSILKAYNRPVNVYTCHDIDRIVLFT